MKLILTQEVDGLGGPGDVVDVKPGYGRNYLVPRGEALLWTKGGQKTVDQIKTARGARAVRDRDHAEQVRTALEGAPVDLPVRAGSGGRLFGSVTSGDIAAAVGSASGESIDKRTIVLGNPIRSLGRHTVGVRLHEEVSATVTLNVVPV